MCIFPLLQKTLRHAICTEALKLTSVHRFTCSANPVQISLHPEVTQLYTNTTESFQNTTSKLQSQNAEGHFFATLIQEQRKVRSRQTSTTASKHLTAHSFCVRRCYLLQRLHLVILTGPQGQLYPTQSRTADTKTWTLDLIISK